MGILDGSEVAPSKTIEVKKGDKTEMVSNPEYEAWLAKDQHLRALLQTKPLVANENMLQWQI